MDWTFVEAIGDNGTTIVINALFLFIVYQSYAKLLPKFERLTSLVELKNDTIDELKSVIEANTKAYSELATAINMMSTTIGSYTELAKLTKDEIAETRKLLDAHDDHVDDLGDFVKDVHRYMFQSSTAGTTKKKE